MIDRSFYVYSSDALPIEEFEKRFAKFQGQNSRVVANYIPSDFIRDSASEMATLELIFNREERTDAIIESKMEGGDVGAEEKVDFNAIVDLCGIFKQSSIHDVRDLIKKHFGPDRFLYVYHIDQADNSDRVLCVNSDNDVQYDEEFYKYLCQTYGAGMREKIFFFVDNRNVIGKGMHTSCLNFSCSYCNRLIVQNAHPSRYRHSFPASIPASLRATTSNKERGACTRRRRLQ